MSVSLDTLYTESGDLVIEEAIRVVNELWGLYVLRYATSKTAEQEDGTALIDVSLDLNGFCDYARPDAMLRSK